MFDLVNVLLVEPKMPRSWGANNQFIGLLKVGAYHKSIGDNVTYVKGCKQLSEKQMDLVCVTSMFTYHYTPVWDAVKFYKKQYPQAKIQLGGIYATLCPEHAKLSGADEIIVGPHPQAKDYPPDPTILSELPKFVYCFTSHGCTGVCTFCATHILYGRGIKQRPVMDVVNEIRLQYKRGFRKIFFGDDDLGHNAENHILPILANIISLKLKIEFYLYGGMQARHITLKMAQMMKQVGFKKLSFGFESANNNTLKRMGRAQLGGKPALEKAVTYLDQVGFKKSDITVFFMIGLPYQKIEDMTQTLIYLLNLGVWIQPQRWAPIPGTVDFKKYNLDGYDLEDLYYHKFVAPNQNNFTDEDLNSIYKISRFFNMGKRYSNYDFLEHRDVPSVKSFINKFKHLLN